MLSLVLLLRCRMGARCRLRAAGALRTSARLVLFPGFRPVSSLPPAREAERRKAQVLTGALLKAPACRRPAGAPSGAPPRRFFTRSPCFFDADRRDFPSRYPGSKRATLH